MKAITVKVGTPDSGDLIDVEAPPRRDGSMLIETIAMGVCGTDLEILAGEYGTCPEGESRLILGHEALGRVIESESDAFSKGDLIVPIVRRPDPVPCSSCAVNEWDMCSNGEYIERGIKNHGYGSEQFRVNPEFAVKIPEPLGLLGILVEPTSVVAKAWDHIDHIGERTHWFPKKVLVTGAGPVGLLAALIGKQKGLEIHVYDKETEGLKPKLVEQLGATYLTGDFEEAAAGADVVIECTGAPSVIVDVINLASPRTIKCLAGVPPTGKRFPVDIGALTRNMVLDNEVLFGSVNANRKHYEAAVEALNNADRSWLRQMITDRVPLESWKTALSHKPNGIKTIITFAASELLSQ